MRQLAENEYQIKGVWTQSVLLYLHDEKLISDEKYFEAVIKLANLNYYSTSINDYILLHASKLANWVSSSSIACWYCSSEGTP